MSLKKIARIRRAKKTRDQIYQSGRIRLTVFKTPRHIYAQLFCNDLSKVLVACSTVEPDIKNNIKYTGNKEAAQIVGKTLAERASKLNITKVAFDRSGFKYHGRMMELSNAAREGGLIF